MDSEEAQTEIIPVEVGTAGGPGAAGPCWP